MASTTLPTSLQRERNLKSDGGHPKQLSFSVPSFGLQIIVVGNGKDLQSHPATHLCESAYMVPSIYAESHTPTSPDKWQVKD